MFSIIQAAGWPIWPLIICSIVALAVVVERLSSLRAARVIPPRLLDEVLSVTRANLPSPDVVNKLADNSILGRVLAGGVRAVIADPRITEEALRGTLESADLTEPSDPAMEAVRQAFEIELGGRDFYVAAAETADDPALRDMFDRLAKM